MIRQLISSFKKKQNERLVYARVVSDTDSAVLVEMLKIAAQKANQDQRELVSSAK